MVAVPGRPGWAGPGQDLPAEQALARSMENGGAWVDLPRSYAVIVVRQARVTVASSERVGPA